MAVKLITKTQRYIGYSSDSQPTSGITDGSVLTEVDTGAKFVWFDGVWEDDLTMIYAVKIAME